MISFQTLSVPPCAFYSLPFSLPAIVYLRCFISRLINQADCSNQTLSSSQHINSPYTSLGTPVQSHQTYQMKGIQWYWMVSADTFKQTAMLAHILFAIFPCKSFCQMKSTYRHLISVICFAHTVLLLTILRISMLMKTELAPPDIEARWACPPI